MAYLNTQSATGASFASTFTAGIETLRQRFHTYRQYRETVNGLSALSNRELADLGLHRSQIRAIALDSVYGGTH